MAVRWLLIAASFYYLSAERWNLSFGSFLWDRWECCAPLRGLADQLLKEADSFLARREGQGRLLQACPHPLLQSFGDGLARGHSAKESEHQKQSKAPLASHGVQDSASPPLCPPSPRTSPHCRSGDAGCDWDPNGCQGTDQSCCKGWVVSGFQKYRDTLAFAR